MNNIKLIIFDLDGVLVDSKLIHFNALNKALETIAGGKYTISYEEHLARFDGLTTNNKLNILTKERGLDVYRHGEIWKLKQSITSELLSKEIKNQDKYSNILKTLQELSKNYKVYCASNCIRNTVARVLIESGYDKYIDYFYSNEDIRNPKPHSEVYLRCMADAGVNPDETIIVEDSPTGLKAAYMSGAHVVKVNGPQDISVERILGKKQQDINIVIPMAGAGSRFEQAGYTFPKPLITVHNKPLIQLVVESLDIRGRYIFICQKSHYEKYNLQQVLNLIAPNCEIIQIDGLTEGAACTILKAEHLIDNDTPLVVANSDQFVKYDSEAFLYSCSQVDGGILTFPNTHSKWSYSKLGDDGFVEEIAEKKPISNHAHVGVFMYNKGKDCVRGINKMIAENKRVNNEFYLAPSINELIQEGQKFKIYDVEQMFGLGVPEDLTYFANNYKG